ncbi:MAG: hypothetical protein ABII96_04615 [Candidatus Zixiibacteriota bacterium]
MTKRKVAGIGKIRSKGSILLLVVGLMFLPASGKAKPEPKGVESICNQTYSGEEWSERL